MTQTHYPTTVQYRDLPPKAKLLRLEVANDLLRQFQYWRGDARLNAWQEGFLANMVRRLRETQGKCRISEKEWVKIREIQVAMEADLPDEMELYEESFEEDSSLSALLLEQEPCHLPGPTHEVVPHTRSDDWP